MTTASRPFQIFAKPAGSACNLACRYCYYLGKEHLFPDGESLPMPDEVLEAYLAQHIEAAPGSVVSFSWHGGEPTILGLDYYRKIVALQRKLCPSGRRIVNGMQTNGTLLDEEGCRFLAAEGFAVGISLDGPQGLHDGYRVTRGQHPSFEQAMRGYALLQRHGIPGNILCVVHAQNVQHPTQVYRFFKQLGARSVEFLPLVEPRPEEPGGVSARSVPTLAWGEFLCTIFDEWMRQDIEQVRVPLFEEAASTALGQEHALCIFRETCGDVPVVEHTGDFFSCDHFVDAAHRLGNIRETSLVALLESPAQRAFGRAKLDTLPRYCRACEFLAMCHGGCPKDRILRTPEGEAGLNYLCAGYRRFFAHCQPFLAQLSALSRGQSLDRQMAATPPVEAQAGRRAGRNDPCPCGSGRKYKKCCLGR
jgi:uncharacterized protein